VTRRSIQTALLEASAKLSPKRVALQPLCQAPEGAGPCKQQTNTRQTLGEVLRPVRKPKWTALRQGCAVNADVLDVAHASQALHAVNPPVAAVLDAAEWNLWAGDVSVHVVDHHSASLYLFGDFNGSLGVLAEHI